ncbi:MAG: lysophospholipid acyltransferase family protein [Synechococcus sp.]
MTSSLATREQALSSGIDPFWSRLAMLLTQEVALNGYFRERIVLGAENLPNQGPVLLAPTHRARWDALMLPMAAGRRVTGRDCRFMVTRTEMVGLQGWFLKRLGCFAVDQGRPSMTTLRFAIDLLAAGEQLVVFPEGRINRTDDPIRLQQGLARLSQLATRQGVPVQVVPVGLAYSEARPRLFGRSALCFAEPLTATGSGREATKTFNLALSERMQSAEQAARVAVGRPLVSP